MSVELNKQIDESRDMHRRGDSAVKEGNYHEAVGYYEKAMSIMPNDMVTLNDLAKIYDRLGHRQKAYESYKLLVLCPPGTVSSTQNDPQVLARYGEYCLQRGDRDEAEFAYKLALENTKPSMGPADPQFKFKIANFNDLRAQALMGAGMKAYFHLQHDEAVELGREALKVKPNWDIGRYYLARYYLDVPPVDAASARREFAVLRDSRNTEIRKRSGDMWEILGLPTEKERIRQWEAEHGRTLPGPRSGSN
jgi:tetratricopeptide (TPR) repeat protein